MPNRSAPGAERPFTDDDLTHLFAPIAKAAQVALAVSGGSDSTALLVLVSRWSKLLAKPPRVTVLTVDHGLRAGSIEEAATVARWTGAAGFVHQTLVWNEPKPKTGIQAAARTARYRLMSAWCRSNDCHWLLTAHTRDDQAETLLMRLARGSGIDGLAGIWPEVLGNGLTIIRPLLHETRSRLRAAVVSAGQDWIEDPSNEMHQFERVRLRKAMPTLAELGLSSEALARTAARALDAHHALAGAAAKFLETSLQHYPTGYGEIDLPAFLDLPDELKRRVLIAALQRYGGLHDEPLSLAGVDRLVHVEAWVQPARTFGGCKLVRRKKTLLIGRESGRIDPQPLTIPSAGEALWDNRFRVIGPAGNKIVPAGVLASVKRDPSLPKFVFDSLPVVLDETGSAVLPHLAGTHGVNTVFVACSPR